VLPLFGARVCVHVRPSEGSNFTEKTSEVILRVQRRNASLSSRLHRHRERCLVGAHFDRVNSGQSTGGKSRFATHTVVSHQVSTVIYKKKKLSEFAPNAGTVAAKRRWLGMPIRRISTELIDEVCGSIRSLEVLNLSHNEISSIENLERLTSLTRLDLGHNRLACISGLDALGSLTHLSLTSNRIRLVTGLEHLRSLETLLLADNLIETPAELRTLAWLPALCTLTLAGNPLLASGAGHSAHVSRLLPSLRLLDGEPLRGGESQAAPHHPTAPIEERLHSQPAGWPDGPPTPLLRMSSELRAVHRAAEMDLLQQRRASATPPAPIALPASAPDRPPSAPAAAYAAVLKEPGGRGGGACGVGGAVLEEAGAGGGAGRELRVQQPTLPSAMEEARSELHRVQYPGGGGGAYAGGDAVGGAGELRRMQQPDGGGACSGGAYVGSAETGRELGRVQQPDGGGAYVNGGYDGGAVRELGLVSHPDAPRVPQPSGGGAYVGNAGSGREQGRVQQPDGGGAYGSGAYGGGAVRELGLVPHPDAPLVPQPSGGGAYVGSAGTGPELRQVQQPDDGGAYVSGAYDGGAVRELGLVSHPDAPWVPQPSGGGAYGATAEWEAAQLRADLVAERRQHSAARDELAGSQRALTTARQQVIYINVYIYICICMYAYV